MKKNLNRSVSPYLKHSNNLIHWYAWGEEALSKAQAENKAIFLFIGYSSCHWSSVMEKESFQDKNIAEILNQRFIAIKVDKEERPDIDKHYQEVYKLMNRRAGGSPTSIFMTENLEPFYAATYISSEAKQEQLGFEELLRVISKKYITDHQTLAEKGQEVLSHIDPKNKKIEATKLDLNIINTITLHHENLIDKVHGGFGTAPKFFNASTIALLFDTFELTKNETLLESILLSLDAMTKGAVYDHVDGGFCHYSTDNKWMIPHFEKTTYDNALLTDVYLRAFQLTGDIFYKEIAFQTIEFMLLHMSRQHLFYASSNAHTHDIEGEYFCYDYDNVVEELTKNNYSRLEITQICTYLNISKDGNFKGKNAIRIEQPKEKMLEAYDDVINILKEIRDEKDYPFIDKKILTSWNAMMITSLFKASTLDHKYKEIAINSLDELLNKMYIHGTLYHSSSIEDEPKVKAFLEDYAYLGEALISAYQATLDETYLMMATKFANTAIEQFYIYGQWNFSNGEFKIQEDIYDSNYPSSVSTVLSLIMSISSLVDINYKKFVFKTLELNSYALMRQPLSSPKLTQITLRYLKDDIIIKSKEASLVNHIEKRTSLGYPYVFFKTTLDTDFMLCNSHSCFANETKFENLKELIGSHG